MRTRKLYHGSIEMFDTIDISKGKGYKDFGPGFYTTGNKEHAIRLARRNKRIQLEKLPKLGLHRSIHIYLYEYTFDADNLKLDGSLIFNKANEEWVKFILTNRSNKNKVHEYSIVHGPTADDDTRLTFNAFKSGVYGDVNDSKAIERLIQFLEPDRMPVQTYFGTKTAADNLKLIRRSIVE